jgi:DnaK suppressor protein
VDAEESSVADIQEDIELALIQMKAETLTRINEALGRLEENTYGRCNECGDEISPQRLRALPFAIRCKDCEEARERAMAREKAMTSRRSSVMMFLDMSS